MNIILRRFVIGTVLIASLTLSGCSSSEDSEQTSFVFAGATLNVINDNANMPVTVSAHTSGDPRSSEIVVEVRTKTVGQSAQTPAWSLTDDTLNLDTPCGGKVIGYCEASYSITVPEKTEVLVNGRRTPVG
ncbi:hypothetical protein B2J88_50495 [Rhodococcus sp. SRB_17]|nr:hypothetical protein [Rhodococcus sp. SRB_17]NMM92136.1 hypothetical protein [Rhodococcus sp. SRB_17]NMM92208.1 hypothetical protein [Rhodococcus sp. SRB_17]NMM92380.1 hypothetical protein [Rhodococcus sp. SRB_17]